MYWHDGKVKARMQGEFSTCLKYFYTTIERIGAGYHVGIESVMYKDRLQNAARWLQAEQHADGGWGMASKQTASIVNTAEAIFVLKKAGDRLYHNSAKLGCEFIQKNAIAMLKKQPRTRYAAFALFATQTYPQFFKISFIEQLVEFLLAGRNDDGGWGSELGSGPSDLFSSTISAIPLFQLSKIDKADVINWILTKEDSQSGWKFSDDCDERSKSATAMALLVLNQLGYQDQRINSHARSIAEHVVLGTEPQELPGAAWSHPNFNWLVRALINCGYKPYEYPISDLVRDMNKLEDKKDRGWTEPNGSLTIRGQFWMVSTFEDVQEGFDPSVHAYQIASALEEANYLEPNFVIMKPKSLNTIIIHSSRYKIFTYLQFLLGLFFLSNIPFIINSQRYSIYISPIFGIILIASAVILIRKRHTYFPSYILKLVIYLTPIVFLILNIKDVLEIWNWLSVR